MKSRIAYDTPRPRENTHQPKEVQSVYSANIDETNQLIISNSDGQ